MANCEETGSTNKLAFFVRSLSVRLQKRGVSTLEARGTKTEIAAHLSYAATPINKVCLFYRVTTGLEAFDCGAPGHSVRIRVVEGVVGIVPRRSNVTCTRNSVEPPMFKTFGF